MESRRKRSRSQILKWCCYVLGLFVCAALQTTPGLFQLGQAKPLLLLPLCLAVSVCEGEFAGALFGMVCGLLWDYTAGRTVGMLALEMMLLCFAVGVLVQLYLQSAPGKGFRCTCPELPVHIDHIACSGTTGAALGGNIEQDHVRADTFCCADVCQNLRVRNLIVLDKIFQCRLACNFFIAD